MGIASSQTPPERLSPPLSLPALGLTVASAGQATGAGDGGAGAVTGNGASPHCSTLDDALRALLRAREELQGLQQDAGNSTGSPAAGADADASKHATAGIEGVRQRKGKTPEGRSEHEAESKPVVAVSWADRPLPAQDRLVVLLDRGGDGSQPEVLGGTFASKNRRRRLDELGVPMPGASDTEGPARLILAAMPQRNDAAAKSSKTSATTKFSLRKCAKRCRRSCWRRCDQGATWCWAKVPQRWKDPLLARLGQYRFYLMCARWAFDWFWQDRHELYREFKVALLGDLAGMVQDAPVCSAQEVEDELRPFWYALCIVGVYCAWGLFRKAMLITTFPLGSPEVVNATIAPLAA